MELRNCNYTWRPRKLLGIEPKVEPKPEPEQPKSDHNKNSQLNATQMWRMGNAGDDGAGAPDEMDNLRSSRSDTVV